jgi:polysaccharide pyruvyl transferase WcaK-like protein
MKTKILVNGHIGSRNLGDEIMLYGLLKNIDDCDVTIITEHIEFLDTEKSLFNCRIIRRSFYSLIRELLRTDHLIMCGGSNFSDLVNPRKYQFIMLYWLFQFSLAKCFNAKTSALGIEIGPVTNKLSFRILKLMGLVLDEITVRDPDSFDLAIDLGLNVKSTLSLSEDLAYEYLRSFDFCAEERIKYGLISLLDYNLLYKRDVSFNSLVTDLRAFAVGMEYIIFLAIDGENDVDINLKLAKELSIPCEIVEYNGKNLEYCVSLLANSSKSYIMRYHAILISHYFNVNMSGIIYHKKVERFFTYMGIESKRFLHINDLIQN